MSAGAFTRTSYQASYGAGTAIHPIRVQPETLAATIDGVANAAPVGAITNPISAITSRNRRAKGLIPRTVTLKAPATAQPTSYLANGLTTIPCLTEAFFNACEAATDATPVTYLGAAYTVSYVTGERAT